MRRLLIPIALLALAAPAGASANFFRGDPIDSGGIVRLGDTDLARDGTGAVAYVKSDAGVDHIFISRFSGGRFGPPERIDGPLPAPSSEPVVGASDDGRLLVAFVNGGTIHGVVRPSAANPTSAPTPLAPGALPAADLSINGTGYVSFTSGGDVRIARLDRRTNAWSVLPQPADADGTREAGVGSARSRVAVSADGVGLVTWGEGGHVWARKMFNAGLSQAPQDLTPPDLAGRATTTSDLPEVDAEDDSSFAWVVFRQQFADGGTRVLARRQRGSAFDPPVPVDAGDEPAGEPRIDLNGRGVGIAATATTATHQPMAAAMKNDRFFSGSRFGAAGVAAPVAVPAIAENNDGLVAAVLSPAGEAPFVRVRPYEEAVPRAEVTVSRPELGPVDPTLGFDTATDRGLGVVITWIQGPPASEADRKLVAGFVDRPPASFAGFTAQGCCRRALPLLSWQASFDLWGQTKYQVFVDGQPRGETTATKLQLTAPLSGGTHKWQITATDIRGQTKRSRTRLLRIDDLRPRQSIRYKRKKRVVTLSVRARDAKKAGQRAAGIRSVRVSWGDGTRTTGVGRVRTSHRYRSTGRFTLEIMSTDKAGNANVNRRTVRIGGK